MKPYIFLIGIAVLGGGCSSMRPVLPMTTAAGGAALAGVLAPKNPAWIAAGAAGGALVGEGIHAWTKKKERQAYAEGYARGRGDAAKQHYWQLQDQQRPSTQLNK